MTTAVLGLGAMGSRIARRIADAGHPVVVWNRSPERAQALATEGPPHLTVASSPGDAVARADLVLTMVTDDDASTALWLDPTDGILHHLRPGSVAVESSTITASTARHLGESAAGAGVDLLEAPVVGSRPQADAGALVALVGGDPDILERVRPRLSTFASTIVHSGTVGSAATLKLAVNALFAVQVAAYAEVVGLLERADLAVEPTSFLSGLPITSPGLQRILGLIETEDFDPNFPVPLVAKDLDYVTRLAADLDAAVPLAERAALIYRTAAHGPAAELDIAGVATVYRPPTD